MNSVLCGAIAGAAGILAIDGVTYGDMAIRGRAASEMPAELVRKAAQRMHFERLGEPDGIADENTKNRRAALGALAGYAIGVTVGMLYAGASPALRRIPIFARGMLVGMLAMSASDVPAALLGAANLAEWDASSWLADVLPHAAYGLATVAIFESLTSSR